MVKVKAIREKSRAKTKPKAAQIDRSNKKRQTTKPKLIQGTAMSE